jgi:hypothetical protein
MHDLLKERSQATLLEVQVMGTPGPTSYRHFAPAFERLFKGPGKIRVLVEVSDLHGWSDGPPWCDLTFDLRRFSHIERLAVVGDREWERGAVAFCRPFTSATIRYFDRAAIRWARAWLRHA